MKPPNPKYPLIFLIFLPWLLSLTLQKSPDISYLIAWLGSFWIFYLTWFSLFRVLTPDLPRSRQIMRPVFLVQLIFAGFMCCTSIFYYLDHIGYVEKVTPVVSFIDSQKTALIAQCQRLSLLGHAALVSGMILALPVHITQIKYQLSDKVHADRFLISLALFSYLAGWAIKGITAIAQLSIGLINIGIIAGAFLLISGIRNKQTSNLLFGGGIFITNLAQSTLTGFKEHILVNFIVMGLLVFPYYKKLTILIGIPVIYGLLYILPTYVTVIRNQAWSGEVSAEEARSEAIETLFDEDETEQIEETNWRFLTHRSSEMEMFTQFVASTPENIDYYGWSIFKNALYALIPRIFWKDKPITEQVAMERVYVANVVDRDSIVSAKPRPVVDGYLSGGAWGVFITLLIYGWLCQKIANQAESFFGGYSLGTVIIFNGLFQPLWRGNNFEFIINSAFYSYVLMLFIFMVLRQFNILIRTSSDENHPY